MSISSSTILTGDYSIAAMIISGFYRITTSQSVSENGDPYENAVAERVNGILKDEFGLDAVFKGKAQLYKQVHQAIELYNQMRLHSSVNMLTPRQAHSKPKIFVKRWKKKEPSK
ncbi:hypothetical protein CA265_24285 [Sphingobacteriaceae bacterium GW460-11-11-14-LB5]|nr:hypothetical protein CA265_24285 [Sphingobacteriaceae bacterium GW460-11-11-14-LB5]